MHGFLLKLIVTLLVLLIYSAQMHVSILLTAFIYISRYVAIAGTAFSFLREAMTLYGHILQICCHIDSNACLLITARITVHDS